LAAGQKKNLLEQRGIKNNKMKNRRVKAGNEKELSGYTHLKTWNPSGPNLAESSISDPYLSD